MCVYSSKGRERAGVPDNRTPSTLHSGCGRGGGKYHTWVMSTVVCIHALTRLAKYHIIMCVHVVYVCMCMCVCVYMPSHQALEWLKLFREKGF